MLLACGLTGSDGATGATEEDSSVVVAWVSSLVVSSVGLLEQAARKATSRTAIRRFKGNARIFETPVMKKKLGSCERGSEERRPGRFSYFTFLRCQVDLDPAIDGYGFQYPCTPELCRINYHTSIRGNTGRFIHLRAGHHIEGAALEILHRHMEFSVAAMHIGQVAPVRGDIRPCIVG